jgi:hypothetical protein
MLDAKACSSNVCQWRNIGYLYLFVVELKIGHMAGVLGVAALSELPEQQAQPTWYDASVNVALGTSCNCECLTRSSLAIGKDCGVVTIQHIDDCVSADHIEDLLLRRQGTQYVGEFEVMPGLCVVDKDACFQLNRDLEFEARGVVLVLHKQA